MLRRSRTGIVNIRMVITEEKILSNIMILDRFFIKGLINDNYNLKMKIEVDEEENILSVDYKLL